MTYLDLQSQLLYLNIFFSHGWRKLEELIAKCAGHLTSMLSLMVEYWLHAIQPILTNVSVTIPLKCFNISILVLLFKQEFNMLLETHWRLLILSHGPSEHITKYDWIHYKVSPHIYKFATGSLCWNAWARCHEEYTLTLNDMQHIFLISLLLNWIVQLCSLCWQDSTVGFLQHPGIRLHTPAFLGSLCLKIESRINHISNYFQLKLHQLWNLTVDSW